MTDPYKVLGVDYEAEDSEIKKVYHALARKYHPDNYAGDPERGELANRKMREINEAYEQIGRDRAAGIRGEGAYRRTDTASGRTGSDSTGGARTASDTYRAWQDQQNGETPYRTSFRYGGNGNEKKQRWQNSDEMPKDFPGYAALREALQTGGSSYVEAQLHSVPELLRNAEWHYLCSLTLMERRRIHDAFREISLACRADPRNPEYREAREEMRRRTGADAMKKSRAEEKQKDFCNNPCADCCFGSMGLEDRKL